MGLTKIRKEQNVQYLKKGTAHTVLHQYRNNLKGFQRYKLLV